MDCFSYYLRSFSLMKFCTLPTSVYRMIEPVLSARGPRSWSGNFLSKSEDPAKRLFVWVWILMFAGWIKKWVLVTCWGNSYVSMGIRVNLDGFINYNQSPLSIRSSVWIFSLAFLSSRLKYIWGRWRNFSITWVRPLLKSASFMWIYSFLICWLYST